MLFLCFVCVLGACCVLLFDDWCLLCDACCVLFVVDSCFVFRVSCLLFVGLLFVVC